MRCEGRFTKNTGQDCDCIQANGDDRKKMARMVFQLKNLFGALMAILSQLLQF